MEKVVTIHEKLLTALSHEHTIIEGLILDVETGLALLNKDSPTTAFVVLNSLVNSSGFKELKEHVSFVSNYNKI